MPPPFYQLWVVHSLIEGKVLPFAYFLIPGAIEEIYTRSFKILQEGIVATEFPDLPANVSYNTQGALKEPPLDVSNVMD
ncbi:hypothetical protein DSO57_1017790 [Entomophthora muscae]|uniref:Uncharacterized protein n=1 Tax=Entomophthora muscae TaxID=34485 RepID=A0ACC2RVT2_9FUNG|nr:hypothetical protein DSO57_1017790 [Entomophthora muscae]